MPKHSKRVAARQSELSKRKKRPAHRPQHGEAEGGEASPSASMVQTDATASVGAAVPSADAGATAGAAPAASRPAQPVAATFKAPRRNTGTGAMLPTFGARKTPAGNLYLASDLRGVFAVSSLMIVVLIVLAIVLN